VRKSDGAFEGLWRIETHQACRLDVTGSLSVFTAELGEDIWTTLDRQTPWLKPEAPDVFHRLVLEPGQCFPRMARPALGRNWRAAIWSEGADKNAVAKAHGQLLALARQLDRICQTVHPSPDNFGAYGHDIRNLLILACTEVESQWRGVLEANGYSPQRPGRFTTTDYVKICSAMGLTEYSVRFPSYPWLEPIHPFERWGVGIAPTADIPWYDAYNAAKHDRENEFARATLLRVFEAMSANVVMLCAQYGTSETFGRGPEIKALFSFEAMPQWSPAEMYVDPGLAGIAKWTSTNYKF